MTDFKLLFSILMLMVTTSTATLLISSAKPVGIVLGMMFLLPAGRFVMAILTTNDKNDQHR